MSFLWGSVEKGRRERFMDSEKKGFEALKEEERVIDLAVV